MQTALAVHGLTRTYGPRKAVDDLTLEVHTGDIYGFLGPNGAGKTTAMRCILGLIRYDSGQISILGRTDPVARRQEVGAIIETPCFHGWMSGADNLKLAGWYIGLSGSTLKTEIERVLERVGLTERAKDRARTYSLGMRQRLGIARALLGKPKLLFLDEPTNGLDPAGMADMRVLIRSLALHDQITVFLSSHLLGEVEAVCNRIGILKEGRLRAEGAVDTLIATNAKPAYRLDAPDDEALATFLSERTDVLGVERIDDGFLCTTDLQPDALNRAAFEAGITLSKLQPEVRDLEDVFMQVVR